MQFGRGTLSVRHKSNIFVNREHAAELAAAPPSNPYAYFMEYRKLTPAERDRLRAQGCTAADWNSIEVCGGFSTEDIRNCGFGGTVRIEGAVALRNVGRLSDCRIGTGAVVEETSVIETTGRGNFGIGIRAAAVNEAGGREIPLFPGLTAQLAYIIAMYRHRPATIARLLDAAEREYAPLTGEPLCTIGAGARITACGILRDVHIGPDAVVEGASLLANGTVSTHAGQQTYIGPDTRLRDFIVCGNSTVDNGTTAERCFFGNATHASALTAADSLFFAGSHCDNGEACSVLAGPYTVSHHKSTLLIAGLFSFFNAGSGTNQSNHLLKSGPVHQGIHLRGCKYGSDAYMMLPALDGPFTTVIGRHKSHPDTGSFPFSLLIEQEGHSWLIPGANLATAGAARDIAKWPQRDLRDAHAADLINFEECNPYIAERLGDAIATCTELLGRETGDVCTCKRMRIRTSMLRRGLRLYRLAYDKYLGAMLAAAGEPDAAGAGRWTDAGGMYLPTAVMNGILDRIDSGQLATAESLREALAAAHERYSAYAAGWACARLAASLGHDPSDDERADAVRRGTAAAEKLAAMTAEDMRSEQDASMSVGYGLDTEDEQTRLADFRAVRRIP